jgi:hypothetical protein
MVIDALRPPRDLPRDRSDGARRQCDQVVATRPTHQQPAVTLEWRRCLSTSIPNYDVVRR